MSFKTALSGLNAAQADLNVIGNNIANVSTAGFKKSRAEFVDVYAASYQGISRLTPGAGVRVSQIQQNMGQGLTEYTDNNLDLAIQGQGFFVVKEGGGTLLSRAGMFTPDRDGFVTNSKGQVLQVFPPNTDGVTFNTGQLVDLQLSTEEGAPSATTSVEIGVQLNADDTALAGPLDVPPGPDPAFEPTDADSYHFTNAVTSYDSLGSPHLLTTYYRKTGTNSWEVYTSLEDRVDDGVAPVTGDGYAEPTGVLPTPPIYPSIAQPNAIAGPVTLVFNPNGTLQSVDGAAPAPVSYEFAIDNGALGGNAAAPAVPGTFNFTLDFDGATQYANKSGINKLSQDGYPTGLLTGINVSDNGVVFANYTNGLATALGKVALATCANPQGLQAAGDSTWQASYEAGEVIYGEPGSSRFGLIQGGALEGSNTNLSEELVALIVAQRNFQANAQAITTENTVTQAIMNIR